MTNVSELPVRELVDIEFAVLDALAIDHAIKKLNELIANEHSGNTPTPMGQVLSIARKKLSEERTKLWLQVLEIAKKYISIPEDHASELTEAKEKSKSTSQPLNSNDAPNVGAQPT